MRAINYISMVLFFPLFVKASIPEDKIEEQVKALYCSAILIYASTGNNFDEIRAVKLLRKAEKINSSLHKDYRTDVVEKRNEYISRLKKEEHPADGIRIVYENLGCDLVY